MGTLKPNLGTRSAPLPNRAYRPHIGHTSTLQHRQQARPYPTVERQAAHQAHARPERQRNPGGRPDELGAELAQGGLQYLELVVQAYPNPISYRGHYYMRSGSTLQELKGAALDRFLLGRQFFNPKNG